MEHNAQSGRVAVRDLDDGVQTCNVAGVRDLTHAELDTIAGGDSAIVQLANAAAFAACLAGGGHLTNHATDLK